MEGGIMAKWMEACKKKELEEGAMKSFVIEGQEIVIAMVKSNYYAVRGRCPHLGGKLAEGKLEGTVITCPLHGSQFDIADGHVIRWTNLSGFMAKVGQAVKPAKPLVTYRVKLEGDAVMVEI
jgi:3-phenylpropionate/trans-cinnamate dioxygenase ferredoxin subunit